MQTYERRPTCQNPGKGDWQIIEVREDGRKRVVDPQHHKYLRHIAAGGAVTEKVWKPQPAPPILDQDQARQRALRELMPEYHAAAAFAAGWDDTRALDAWKVSVQARAKELEG